MASRERQRPELRRSLILVFPGISGRSRSRLAELLDLVDTEITVIGPFVTIIVQVAAALISVASAAPKNPMRRV